MNKTVFVPLFVFSLFACGDASSDRPMVEKAQTSADSMARETDPMLETDLSQFSATELSQMLLVLKKTNAKQARDLKVLRRINAGYCSKLVEVKKQCTALAPMMNGFYNQLPCAKEQLTNEITVKANGKYKLIADNLYESPVFEGDSQSIEFRSVNGGNDLDVRFIDVSSLVLKSEGGGASDASGTGFELAVNGVTMFDSGDLEKDGSDFKIKLSKFLEITKSESCNISRSELDVIRQKARASLGGAQ